MINKKEIANDILLNEVRNLISEGHTVTIRAKGVSMHPFLDHLRDKINLVPFNSLSVGDVVLAEIDKGLFVLHRIINISGDKLTLMGDGNICAKEYCDKKDAIAIMSGFIRNGKEWSCDSKKWKKYSSLWMKLYPVRRWLLAIYRRSKKLFNI